MNLEFFGYFLNKPLHYGQFSPMKNEMSTVLLACFDNHGHRKCIEVSTSSRVNRFKFGKLLRVQPLSSELSTVHHVKLSQVEHLLNLKHETKNVENRVVYTMHNLEVSEHELPEPGVYLNGDLGVMNDFKGFMAPGKYSFVKFQTLICRLERGTMDAKGRRPVVNLF